MSAVERERRGHVEILTINRPEARNAINGDVSQAMSSALDELETDDDDGKDKGVADQMLSEGNQQQQSQPPQQSKEQLVFYHFRIATQFYTQYRQSLWVSFPQLRYVSLF